MSRHQKYGIYEPYTTSLQPIFSFVVIDYFHEMKYSTFTFQNFDGKEIAGYRWTPDEGEPKAVMLLVHGMAEHCARYSHFAQFLNSHGFAVIGYDHPGHGQTDPENLGYINSEDGFHYMVQTVRDFMKVATDQFPGLPQVLFAHSMGTFLAQRYFQLYDDLPEAVIYSGGNGRPPAILQAGIWLSSLIVKIKGGASKSLFLNKLTFGEYNKKFKPARTEMDWLSRDEEQVDLYINDPLCGFICSASFYSDLFKGLKTLHSHTPFAGNSSDLPILLLSGESDPVSEMGKGIPRLEKALVSSGATKVQKKIYPGGRHEMLNEINRDEVISDILHWIKSALNLKIVNH